MKRIIYSIMLLAVLTSCQESHRRSSIERKVAKYELVKIPMPDISYISDNGKEVLNLYKFIADEADSIYWEQCFGDKKIMENLKNSWERDYAMINYGPWDRLTGKSFIKGYGDMPLGVKFYPSDMSNKEFDSFDDDNKLSPYTLIRRDDKGKLTTVWYHDAYKKHIEKMCNYLTAAADITIKPSVKNYLLKKAEALKTDNYYESSLAWLDMNDSKMDLVVGPNENADDQLYGLKNSYEAFVLLKDTTKTSEIDVFTSKLKYLQKILPCKEEYKTFVPGEGSNIFACNAIYYAGKANAGIKVIAINLPYDAQVQKEKGTRTIILKNILEEKFHRIIHPTGRVLIEQDQIQHIDPDAFFWNIVFREVAHGLGVKETINGFDAFEALGNQALTFEDMKANIVGLYLVCKLIDNKAIPALITKEDAITTYFANLLRSERFGPGEGLGRANIIIFNYLREKGAFIRTESDKYVIDFNKATKAIEEFAGMILEIQAQGNYTYASQFAKDYSKLSKEYYTDVMNLGLENVPIDLRFEFEK